MTEYNDAALAAAAAYPIADGGKVHADAWSTERAAADLQTGERKRETWERVTGALRIGRSNIAGLFDGVPTNERPGMTDDELRHWLEWAHDVRQSKSGPATRRGELVELGYVRPQRDEHGVVIKRPSDLGGPMIVWELVPADEYVAPTPNLSRRRPNAAGLAAVERWLRWEVGDPSYARDILRAYLNPATVQAELDAEGAD